MNTKPTAAEREHLGRVKLLPCSVCDAPGPSEAHHIELAALNVTVQRLMEAAQWCVSCQFLGG